MTKEHYEVRLPTKKEAIRAYFEDVLTEIDQGGSPKILTNPEVSKQLGVNLRTVTKAVKGDLQEKIAAAREMEKDVSFEPSSESALFLGMMMGGGKVGKDSNGAQIVFTNKDMDVLKSFKTTGEDLMKISGQQIKMRAYGNPSVVLYSKPYARLLGDFQRDKRANTIHERFGWSLEEPYVKDFTSGVFDASGSIILNNKSKKVVFFTSHPASADLYRMMLLRLGIERPVLIENAYKKHGIEGIGIFNVPDLQVFAEQVTSVSTLKQRQLSVMKDLGIIYRKHNISPELFPE